jgi:4-hydroxy-tetrahydrodipicolinate reductase
MKIKIAQLGLGPIGLETIKLAASKPWAAIVGAIDIDPAKVGRDLEELTGLRALRGKKVVDSIEALLERGRVDAVLHTAVSRFQDAFDQIEPLARRGISVVSSCEELVFPQLRNPRLARRLDKVCIMRGARVLGAGVNPGFVMDLLPTCLTGVCREVRGIRVDRVVDAATRREPLQRKIGSGLPPARFQRMLSQGKAGHAGLKESLALLAHALGWKVGPVRETGCPIVADRGIRTRFLKVKPGETCGLHQHAWARTADGRILELDLKMYLGARQPQDAIRIDGSPPLDVVIRDGVAGDAATVAALVNSLPALLAAPAGLRLLTDMPLPRLT